MITVKHMKGPGARGGGWSPDSGRTYSLRLVAITDDPNIGPRAVELACGVDAGDHYRFPLDDAATEEDFGTFLSGINVEEVADDGMQWNVTLEYKQYSAVDVAGAQTGVGVFVLNPIAAPPTISWDSADEDIALTTDRNGEPILNTVGDPFDPPLADVESTPVAVITRKLAAFDPNWLALKNKVNKYEWNGFAANTVKILDITADKSYDADWGWIWTQTLKLGFRPIVATDDGATVIRPGWSRKILNAGKREIKGAGEIGLVMIDNAPVSSDVALKEDGTYDPDADPYYVVFDVDLEADFEVLNLPADLFTAGSFPSPTGGS